MLRFGFMLRISPHTEYTKRGGNKRSLAETLANDDISAFGYDKRSDDSEEKKSVEDEDRRKRIMDAIRRKRKRAFN